MATYYADKALEIQTTPGNVMPVDTHGRMRVFYDQFEVGGDVPTGFTTTDEVIFGGAGIPNGARIVGGTMQWEDLSVSSILWVVDLIDEDGTEVGIELLGALRAGASLDSTLDGSSTLRAVNSTEGNAPVVSGGPAFIRLTCSEGTINGASVDGKSLSIAVYYVLD